MTLSVPASAFRAATTPRARLVDGLSIAIDAVAEAALPEHAFLRHGWFAASLAAYGGHSTTLIVEEGARPVLAMPLVPLGPAVLGLKAVPGSYWPFRSFPVAAGAAGAGEAVWDAALTALAGHARGLRIGPVYDGDVSAAALIERARARGWAAIDRFVADSWLLDMAAMRAAGPWPRGSTLRKNRFHEKHLGSHGALDWRFVDGADWTGRLFDGLAKVEEASWIAARTDGGDAKFTTSGHGAFWRAAAADPVVAGMMRAAVLCVDGREAAFSFNLDMPAGDGGALRYAIANSYDPQFAKHSPGKLLQYRDMTDAMARGVAKVDWGAGDSGYKQVIGAAQGPAIRDWLLLRPGLPALAGRLLARVWRQSGNPTRRFHLTSKA
jgi:hypothetical protein